VRQKEGERERETEREKERERVYAYVCRCTRRLDTGIRSLEAGATGICQTLFMGGNRMWLL